MIENWLLLWIGFVSIAATNLGCTLGMILLCLLYFLNLWLSLSMNLYILRLIICVCCYPWTSDHATIMKGYHYLITSYYAYFAMLYVRYMLFMGLARPLFCGLMRAHTWIYFPCFDLSRYASFIRLICDGYGLYISKPAAPWAAMSMSLFILISLSHYDSAAHILSSVLCICCHVYSCMVCSQLRSMVQRAH